MVCWNSPKMVIIRPTIPNEKTFNCVRAKQFMFRWARSNLAKYWTTRWIEKFGRHVRRMCAVFWLNRRKLAIFRPFDWKHIYFWQCLMQSCFDSIELIQNGCISTDSTNRKLYSTVFTQACYILSVATQNCYALPEGKLCLTAIDLSVLLRLCQFFFR